MAEDRRLFGITGDWSTAVLYSGVSYSTVHEGGCRLMTACIKEEVNTSKHRQRKREAEGADRLRIHLE